MKQKRLSDKKLKELYENYQFLYDNRIKTLIKLISNNESLLISYRMEKDELLNLRDEAFNEFIKER